MDAHRSADDARSAVATVGDAHRRVVDEVDLPRWYWLGLAAGWVVLGLVADADRPVVSVIATVGFGAAHAAVAPRVLAGRRRSGRLQVRSGVVTRHLPAIIVGSLVVLVGLTVLGALALAADGSQHPSTVASVAVALVILGGGPQLLATVRRRAALPAAAP